MPKAELSRKTKTTVEDNTNLKGTLASVFLVGFFIVAVWVSVYFLYVGRF